MSVFVARAGVKKRRRRDVVVVTDGKGSVCVLVVSECGAGG